MFRSFTELELSEFNMIYNGIESKYPKCESGYEKKLGNKKCRK